MGMLHLIADVMKDVPGLKIVRYDSAENYQPPGFELSGRTVREGFHFLQCDLFIY